MSNILKNSHFCADLDSLIFAIFSDNTFHGIVKENKYMESQYGDDYTKYPIYFDAKQKRMIFYMDKPVSTARICDSHIFDYKFVIALRDIHIQSDYHVNENETECVLLLESSREYEATTDKNIETLQKIILADSDFIEIHSDSMQITRCIMVQNITDLILRKSGIYYMSKEKNRLTINLNYNDVRTELSITFNTEDECNEKYKQLMDAI